MLLRSRPILQFHKRQERDLLDQKKEKEENLLLEMVSLVCPHRPVRVPSLTHVPPLQELLERQQMDEKINADKHLERKRESEQEGWFETVTQHKVDQRFVARTGRDSKTSLSATKSMSMSSSGATLSSSGETAATTGRGHLAKLATLSPHFH